MSILQMRTLRLRVVMLLAYGHTAGLNTSPLSHALSLMPGTTATLLAMETIKKKKKTPLGSPWQSSG